jgi:hypothetical protein
MIYDMRPIMTDPDWDNGTTQVVDCPCLDCKHEFFVQCIKLECECCAFEDRHFLMTGEELRDT